MPKTTKKTVEIKVTERGHGVFVNGTLVASCGGEDSQGKAKFLAETFFGYKG